MLVMIRQWKSNPFSSVFVSQSSFILMLITLVVVMLTTSPTMSALLSIYVSSLYEDLMSEILYNLQMQYL